MISTPTVIHAAPQVLASIPLVVPRSEMRRVMGPAIAELMDVVRTQGLGPTGPWFDHHFDIRPDTFDFEICVPVLSPVLPAGRVVPAVRHGMRMVQTVLQGDYEQLEAAWKAFDAWVHQHGHKVERDFYQCYVVGPETSQDPADWRTELSRRLLD